MRAITSNTPAAPATAQTTLPDDADADPDADADADEDPPGDDAGGWCDVLGSHTFGTDRYAGRNVVQLGRSVEQSAAVVHATLSGPAARAVYKAIKGLFVINGLKISFVSGGDQ